ncbi:hypothetical protein LIA77_04209 [Sarocladium implicatum]|nr:hypothetical protein LIA77_04209 [Sarocladium implicatum]
MPNSISHDGASKAAVAALITPSSSPTTARRQNIKRAITELSPPGKLSLHSIQAQTSHHPNDHRHRLHHRYHHRKHVSHDVRRAQEDDPKHLARHSIDMGRSSVAPSTPLSIPVPSRKTSVVQQKEMDKKFGPAILEPRPKKADRLREAQKKAEFRADGLKESLAGLQDFAADATKRLDDTYYSVLEKMDALQNTITALRELAETSHDVYGSFEKDSRDLEHEIVSQIGSLGRFDDQQSKIESLQSRIEGGRARIAVLSQRVDVVRERVEGWEEADRDWQEKTRKKMKLIWSSTMVVVLAVLLLFLGLRGSIPESMNPKTSLTANTSGPDGLDGSPNTTKPLTPLDFAQKPGPDEDHTAKDEIAEIQEALEQRRRRVDEGGLRALDEL